MFKSSWDGVWALGADPQCHVEERDRAFRADAALSDAAFGVFDGE
jgi:hypothetical protein